MRTHHRPECERTGAIVGGPTQLLARRAVAEQQLKLACERIVIPYRKESSRARYQLGVGGNIGRNDGAAPGEGLEDREPESLIDRSADDDRGVPVEGVEERFGNVSEQPYAGPRKVRQILRREPPVRSGDHERQRRVSGSQAIVGGNDRRMILAGLDGSDTKEVWIVQPRPLNLALGDAHVGLRYGPNTERNVVHSTRLETFSQQLVASEARRRDDRGGFAARDGEALSVEADAVAREHFRVAKECQVVDAYDERGLGRRHGQAWGMADVEIEIDSGSPHAVPHLVAPAGRVPPETAQLTARAEGRRYTAERARRARGEPDDAGMPGQLVTEQGGDTTGAARGWVEELTDVNPDSQPARCLGRLAGRAQRFAAFAASVLLPLPKRFASKPDRGEMVAPPVPSPKPANALPKLDRSAPPMPRPPRNWEISA